MMRTATRGSERPRTSRIELNIGTLQDRRAADLTNVQFSMLNAQSGEKLARGFPD
jgi:hypothetical protein